jgi:hypothetical protein
MPRRRDDRVSGSAAWRPHDTDRSIDPFDEAARGSSRPPSSRAASSRPPVPPSRPSSGSSATSAAKQASAKQASAKSAGRLPESAGGRGQATGVRTALLVGGAVLAVGATLLVFLTDNPDLLRVAVVAAAWAFVLATFVAGRRRADETAAEGREHALRRAYEHQLEREVAARREYELELENELRRETEDAMRGEIDALREDLAGITALREEVARVAELRDDVAALSGLRDEVSRVAALRDEVARVAALRDDVLALTALRAELGQVGELRADLGRLRAELTEQLSSEMLVERIVMRTQASRLTGETGRLEPPPTWREEPPHELTGGWAAARLDDAPSTQQYPAVGQPATQHHPVTQQYESTRQYESTQQYEGTAHFESTQQFERIRVDRPGRAWDPSTGGFRTSAEPPAARPIIEPVPMPEPPSWAPPATEGYGLPDLPRRSRHSAAADDPEPLPTTPPPSPVEWLAARSQLDGPAADRPQPRRRRTDDDALAHPLLQPSPDDLRTTERPVAPAPSSADYPFGSPAPLPEQAAVEPASSPSPEHVRVDQILADSGVTPATGSRRRRRYREDDGADDVLSRVLRGG